MKPILLLLLAFLVGIQMRCEAGWISTGASLYAASKASDAEDQAKAAQLKNDEIYKKLDFLIAISTTNEARIERLEERLLKTKKVEKK